MLQGVTSRTGKHVLWHAFAQGLLSLGKTLMSPSGPCGRLMCIAITPFVQGAATVLTMSGFMQASRKVRPILEQAAAAAAIAIDTEGIAKAQAAAKKAKKLTPEEMQRMRQQADPNYQKKQAAATGTSTSDSVSKHKGKKGKGPAGKAEPATKALASLASDKVPAAGATQEDEVAAKHSTAQAQHDQASAAGSKRRHGLGFTEDQPEAKKSKHDDEPGKAAATDGTQHAPSNSKQDISSHKPPAPQGQQSKPAGGQAAAAASNSGAAQSQPVIFTDECTAFVRGIDNKVTEDELRGLLAPCGEIKDVRLVMDKVTGLFKVPICPGHCMQL